MCVPIYMRSEKKEYGELILYRYNNFSGENVTGYAQLKIVYLSFTMYYIKKVIYSQT